LNVVAAKFCVRLGDAVREPANVGLSHYLKSKKREFF